MERLKPHPQNLPDREFILVASSVQIHHDDLVPALIRRALDDIGERLPATPQGVMR
jgi:hypothetical protein